MIRKVSVMYNFVRSRQLEGSLSQGPDVGTWPITSARVMRGWGAPEESAWPYSARHWPPEEPPGLDAMAKESRILAYQRIRDSRECKVALESDYPVFAAFEITNQWFSAANGVIEDLSPGSTIGASHAVLIVGYDDEKGLFTFQNSWGLQWGDSGYGYLPYPYFNNHILEAWTYNISQGSREGSDEPKILVTNWGVEDVLGGVLHGVELYDAKEDECIGWAFAVCRSGFLDIEDLYVRPAFQGFGYGNALAQMLSELMTYVGLPLRLWVPHADMNRANLIRVERIAKRLSLKLTLSNVRWASLKAVA